MRKVRLSSFQRHPNYGVNVISPMQINALFTGSKIAITFQTHLFSFFSSTTVKSSNLKSVQVT